MNPVEIVINSVNHIKQIFSNIIDSETLYSGFISGLGSFLGGVIGSSVAALVAYKVARNQINIDKNKTVSNHMLKCRNYLILLIHELNHNKLIYISYKLETKDSTMIGIETEVWDEIRFEVNDFLELRQYDVIEELYREMKDFKQRLVQVDFDKRTSLFDKIIDELNKRLELIESELKIRKLL